MQIHFRTHIHTANLIVCDEGSGLLHLKALSDRRRGLRHNICVHMCVRNFETAGVDRATLRARKKENKQGRKYRGRTGVGGTHVAPADAVSVTSQTWR